jgi:catechol 2,3-dioxygenase-like lactoylglutathione lyase family enzyme
MYWFAKISRKGSYNMIAYVTVGADNISLAKRFYSAFLPSLNYELKEGPAGLSYVLPVPNGQRPAFPDFYVKPTFNGQLATAGNGTMIAFEAQTQSHVRALYAAALAAGGTSEGEPGFRAYYGANFYVSYLRDPQGNKIALFSCNPDEPGREG